MNKIEELKRHQRMGDMQSFERWRNDQFASLVRTGYVEEAKAFLKLGSVHWMAWQSAWKASREELVIELPEKWGEYIAQDADGVWHGYNLEPYAYQDQWQRLDLNMFSGGKFVRIGRTDDCENWKESLEGRP